MILHIGCIFFCIFFCILSISSEMHILHIFCISCIFFAYYFTYYLAYYFAYYFAYFVYYFAYCMHILCILFCIFCIFSYMHIVHIWHIAICILCILSILTEENVWILFFIVYYHYCLVPHPRAQLFTYHHLQPSPPLADLSQLDPGKSADSCRMAKGIVPVAPTGTRGRRPSIEETGIT